MKKPLLSIVTPTRGNFTPYWLEQLLLIRGDVEFLLIYPPGEEPKAIPDQRVRTILSPAKGELAQRSTGVLNASGKFTLALDDDDYLHPEVVSVIEPYFDRFPDSLVLRFLDKSIKSEKIQDIRVEPWTRLKAPNFLTAGGETAADILREVPIAPLDKNFNFQWLINPFMKRTDYDGPHMENFTNKVWRSDVLKKPISVLSSQMTILGPIRWQPSWSFDRLPSLFIQAFYYKSGMRIGHWMVSDLMVQRGTSVSRKGEYRYILFGDCLLLKKFPQYGYFWNLFFEQFWGAVKMFIHSFFKK